MKIQDLLTETADFDDVIDDTEIEQDQVENIIMQLRKSLDIDGQYAIQFEDGSEAFISVDDIKSFLEKIQTIKPANRLDMQNKAVKSLPDFYKVLRSTNDRVMEKSLYADLPRSRSGGPTQYS